MKKIFFLFVLALLLQNTIAFCQTNKKDFPIVRGSYFGQKPPGTAIEIFAPGIVSRGMEEGVIAFMPDGKECYWSVLFSGLETILTSRIENGKWTEPEVASFAGEFYDGWPAIQPDGKRMYFHSSRPNKEKAAGITAKYNIWYMDRTENGWSEPKIVDTPVNGSENSSCPSVTKDGSIYFSKRFSDDTEKICSSKLINGIFQPLEILPASINTAKDNFHAFVSPDESCLIMPVYGKKDAIGGGWNYYVSFKKNGGQWSELINLGKKVNSGMPAGASSFSPDGKYLFLLGRVPIKNTLVLDRKYTLKELIERDYKTHSNGSADIYWIDAKIINDLNSLNVK